MRVGTRFPVAIHILLLVETFKGERKVTSDFIAGSVNTNPVVIRKLMGLLREAGLIEVAAGTGGIALTRPPEEISLLDIYRASEPVEDSRLFSIHEDTAPLCPVGGNIAALLRGPFEAAEEAMEGSLGETSLRELLDDLAKLNRRARSARKA
jgi:DNA-binding IscR family transcriptional regulator